MPIPLTEESALSNVHADTKRVKLGTTIKQLTRLLAALDLAQGGRVLRPPTLSNSTTSLAIGAFSGIFNGLLWSLPAGTKALTATTHDVAQAQWASFRVSAKVITSGSGAQTVTLTVTITKSADVASEALAVAAVPALPSADDIDLGFFTVRGGDSTFFDATTNNLQSGAVTGMVVNFYPTTTMILESGETVRTLR